LSSNPNTFIISISISISIGIVIIIIPSHCPGLDHIFIQLGPAFLTPHSLPAVARELFLVGNQYDNTQSLKPLSSSTCEGTPSINSRIIKVVSTLIFVILTWYCHISSQWGGVPTKCKQVDGAMKEVWEGHGQPNEDVIYLGTITSINFRVVAIHTPWL
jgi:hypothetical protein